MRSRLVALSRLLRFRGPGYLLYLLTGCVLPRLARELLLRAGSRRLRLLAAVTASGAAALGLGSIAALGASAGAGMAALLALGSFAGFLLLRRRRRSRRLAEARSPTPAPEGFFLAWSDWPVPETVRKAVATAPAALRAAGSKGEVVLGQPWMKKVAVSTAASSPAKRSTVCWYVPAPGSVWSRRGTTRSSSG